MDKKGFCPHRDPEYTGPSNFWCDDCAEIKDKARDLNQRRYEIARDVMAAMYAANDPTVSLTMVVEEAIAAADALLKALEESSDGV